MSRVECEVAETEIENEQGRLVAGVCVTCRQCGHQEEAFGTSDRSIRSCLARLRENCPEGEENFYVNEDE